MQETKKKMLSAQGSIALLQLEKAIHKRGETRQLSLHYQTHGH